MSCVKKYDVGDSSIAAYVNEKLKDFLNNFFIMVIARLGILIYLVFSHFFVNSSGFNFTIPLSRGLLKSFMRLLLSLYKWFLISYLYNTLNVCKEKSMQSIMLLKCIILWLYFSQTRSNINVLSIDWYSLFNNSLNIYRRWEI